MHLLGMTYEEKLGKISRKEISICIVGLGKMGLPIATVFTNAGFKVHGLDISEELIEQLNRGETVINEPFVSERLKEAIDNNLFHATTSTELALKEVSFVIFIIPVLTSDDGHADISILESTYNRVRKVAEDGIIYIQESTLPPGLTSGPIKQLLESDDKVSGIDFGLVFAPERTFSGRAVMDIEENYPKIVGGDTENATIAAKILYEQVCRKGVIKMSSATAAEAVKTFKGAYRDANIAIANELAILADIYGVDVLEVIEAANTEPFSHIHRPGIGVGGHCIPVYPRFLIALAKDFNYKANLLDISRNINDGMVNYAVSSIEKNIDKWEDVLVLGLAYRGGVKEYRLSPSLRLVPQLRMKGININVIDPLYSADEIDALFGKGTGKNWDINEMKNYNIIVIVTEHEEFNELNELLKNSDKKIIFDGRYVLDKNPDHTILQPGRLFVNKQN